jgi:ABC-type branched-subunit amino acid transport system substrate-binding protein
MQTGISIVNKAGGIAGHQVALDIQNDAGSPTQAAQVALKLVSDRDAAVIYGGIPDSELQAVPVLAKYKMPVIFQDYGQMQDASKYPYLFATWPNLQSQFTPLASYAKQHGWNTIAIFGDGSTFGDLNATAMKAALTAAGLTVTATVNYSPTATDISSQISQAKNSGANTIAVVATGGQGAVWDGLHASNWSPHIMTLDTSRFIGYSELKGLATTAVTACYLPRVGPGIKLDSNLVTYLKAVQKALPTLPAASLATAPDYMLVLDAVKSAIEQAKSVDPAAIKAAMETWKNEDVFSPLMTLTYSPTNHDGRSGPGTSAVCQLDKQGPYGLDIAVGASS